MALKWRMLGIGVLLALSLSACVGGDEDRPERRRNHAASTDRPPVRVCDDDSLLGGGPKRVPPGAVEVPAGDNSSVDFTRDDTTFWFAPGRHTLADDEFSAIVPGDGSRYAGAPGAVLDGRKTNRYAFKGYAEGVTVEYLTIRGFGPRGSNNNEGVVNHDSADNWTIRYNTVTENAGAGVMVGSGNVVRYNCLTRNEQYGFNAYSQGGPVDITLDHNEVSYNNTYDWEARIEGCGCTGGGKFWSVSDATVTDNYVHHNRSVGLWADNNNRGFLFENNYISDNHDVGLLYETSYNAEIRGNTILRNALVAGPENPGFPTGGIYVSESGADRRVDTRYSDALEITDNLFKDNWGGIVLWENADRYCGSPANTSTGECTLVNPDVVTAKSCNPANITDEPYLQDCRWRTQNVKVHDNVFEHDPARIGPDCRFSLGCGVSSLMANYGSYPDWSPYQGRVVQRAVTYQQGNRFYDNVYRGAWRFLPFEQNNLRTFGQWRQAPYRQDSGSRLRRSKAAASADRVR